jgi:putative protease
LGRQLHCRPAELHVLCRSLRQLQAVLACGVKSTMVDLADFAECEEAVRIAHAAGACVLLATTRIQKPGEKDAFHLLARCGADGILARNLAGLCVGGRTGTGRGLARRRAANPAFSCETRAPSPCVLPVVADFSLNAANQLTFEWLREQGAARVTASYDLDRDQLLDLVAAVPAEWLEVVVHQHVPMFHTEHCVFCATLPAGQPEGDNGGLSQFSRRRQRYCGRASFAAKMGLSPLAEVCGRPCARHAVRLRDRLGVEHPLRADAACRNTLYHAVPQSAAELVPLLVERGVRHFRIELLDEAPPPAAVIGAYRELLAGHLTGRQAWGKLQAMHPAGLGRGAMR